MKRHLATAIAASLVVAALTACVPLDEPAPTSSPVSETPLLEPPVYAPLPSTPVPDLELYSTKGLSERVALLSKDSPARQILSGTFDDDGAVPGSVKLLFAESAMGEQEALIPLDGKDRGLGLYVDCAKETGFEASLVDGLTGRKLLSSSGPCEPSTYFGSSTGNARSEGPVYLTVKTSSPTPTEVVVYSFESKDFS